jgi:hypothetical protein
MISHAAAKQKKSAISFDLITDFLKFNFLITLSHHQVALCPPYNNYAANNDDGDNISMHARRTFLQN